MRLVSFAIHPDEISKMQERRDVAGLLRALRSPDFAVQTAAARALGSMGDAPMDELTGALTSHNKDVRLGVIGALAVIRDPRSAGPLIDALSDKNSEVRWQAAFALGELGDARAVVPLTAALKDPDKYVRYGAALALEKLGQVPRTAKDQAFYLAAREDWTALAAMGAEAVPALAAILSDRDPVLRQKAVSVLGETGSERAVPALVTALSDANSEVRWAAVLAAPKCGMDPLYIPRGISRRPRTAKNPLVAGILNFLLPGLGYGYLGKWWGIMIFQIDITATVWLFKYEGEGSTYGLLFPVYVILAVHAWYLAKKMPDFA